MPIAARRTQESESARLKRALPALVASWIALPTGAFAVESPKAAAHPLLELARERERTRDKTPRGAPGVAELREAEHQLQQARVPRDADCAGSVGATRFAALHIQLGQLRSGEGDFAGAAVAFRSAQACRPHDAGILAALADVLFDARDYAGARAAIDESLAIDARDISANRLAGNLDYVEQRWADAITRFRYIAASDPDRRPPLAAAPRRFRISISRAECSCPARAAARGGRAPGTPGQGLRPLEP